MPLAANATVYVPGHTAHRTIKPGTEPLVYWGVLSSDAGHDYGTVAERNFTQVVVDMDGQPQVHGARRLPAAPGSKNGSSRANEESSHDQLRDQTDPSRQAAGAACRAALGILQAVCL